MLLLLPAPTPTYTPCPLLPLPCTLQLLCSAPVACTTQEANIPGLLILQDFVSEQEEQQLLSHIDSQPWQHLAKRRVQHYGFRFEYMQRGVDLQQQVEPLPDWTQQLVQRVQVSDSTHSAAEASSVCCHYFMCVFLLVQQPCL